MKILHYYNYRLTGDKLGFTESIVMKSILTNQVENKGVDVDAIKEKVASASLDENMEDENQSDSSAIVYPFRLCNITMVGGRQKVSCENMYVIMKWNS